MNTIAFTGTLGSKSEVVALAKHHRETDMLLRGTYGNFDGKACSIGCMFGGKNHGKAPEMAGVSIALTYYQDRLFEKCPDEKTAADFHVAFWEAIPEHADTSRAIWLVLSRMFGKRETIEFPEKILEIRAMYSAAFLQNFNAEPVDFVALSYLADRADRTDRVYRADLADLAYRTDLAYRADLADRTDRAYHADHADHAEFHAETREIFLQALRDLPVVEISVEPVL